MSDSEVLTANQAAPNKSWPNAKDSACHWPHLPGSALALALAQAVQQRSGCCLIIIDSARERESLRAELKFFLPADFPVLLLPDWEILAYDRFSPVPELISERLTTLAALPSLSRGVVIASFESLLQRLPPRDFIDGQCFDFVEGETFDLEAARGRLMGAGYAQVATVNLPGEFAVRGSLFDVFPMGSRHPLRIDLLDGQIDSLREFDPESQRSGERRTRLRVLPAREFPLDEAGCKAFRRRYRARFEGEPTRSEIYRSLREGQAAAGIEFYLPLFFDSTTTLQDYLPASTVWVLENQWSLRIEDFWKSLTQRFEDLRHDRERPILNPQELYLAPEEARLSCEKQLQLLLAATPADPDSQVGSGAASTPPRIRGIDLKASAPLAAFASDLQNFGGRCLLLADSAGRREYLAELLRSAALPFELISSWQQFSTGTFRLGLTTAAEVRGMQLTEPALLLLSDLELFGQRVAQERRRRRSSLDPAVILRDLADLTLGAPIVHASYGVGRYAGLLPMQIADQPGEFMAIEYAGGDRIYVPVTSLHLVSRYTGADADSAPLHKLGTEQWARARRRASQQVRDVAADLLDLYARRQAKQGICLKVDPHELQAFAASFPFEETADQAEAIQSVLADLASDKPMDRVVCGDVGFGKTEVAMRAAFATAMTGRQVALLAPTTLLAEQHLNTFRDRFADLPFKIESLSRFRSPRESERILAGLKSGQIDILIATHRLLHTHPEFQSLGLLIIDEEHRFGVRDKERLKALKAEVHVLTLTATPIPRTLNMALGGLRDLSLITTPPAGRVAIKTFVMTREDAVIREAALRELRRGGQIYFVHNQIESIEKVAAALTELLPEARVRVGHGQMRERDLELLMADFYHRRFDVLLCTTIIESGIDVPNANTIMIDRADRLGLAQLHQLRGRVGRSHHRAYAYLFTPPKAQLTADAAKRLEAIASLEELGAGFMLATHDLEIRGAGEFLGESQSGDVQEVGLAMYLDMLDEAVRAMKSGREPQLDKPLASPPEIALQLPGLLPEDFIGDVPTRLTLYKRIAAATDREALAGLHSEIADRFGALPQPALNLLEMARLTLRCRSVGIQRLTLGAHSGHVTFQQDHQVQPERVLKLIQQEPKRYRLEGSLVLRIAQGAAENGRVALADAILDRLGVVAV